jgi:N-acetylmuramoyl-L-alanine amidase
MSRFLLLALVLIFPLGIYAGLVAIDRLFGLPGRGYDYVLHIELPSARKEIGLPDVLGPQDASRPLVVIDPGHGGHDPGASGWGNVEKDVVLAIARDIRDRLLEEGGVRVALTRDEDQYLMFAERTGIARRLDADLFISIHADSAENDQARGASVYVLSERGSSEAAERFAARQNSADRINGVEIDNNNGAVGQILLDLSQREAQAGSEEMARLVLREIDGEMEVHTGRVQSAAFAVLKAPDVPSVLFETGYINNRQDAAWLVSGEGRRTISEAAARAIRAFLARQSVN